MPAHIFFIASSVWGIQLRIEQKKETSLLMPPFQPARSNYLSSAI